MSRAIVKLVFAFAAGALSGCASSPASPPERVSLDASGYVELIRSWQNGPIQVSRRWSNDPSVGSAPVSQTAPAAPAQPVDAMKRGASAKLVSSTTPLAVTQPVTPTKSALSAAQIPSTAPVEKVATHRTGGSLPQVQKSGAAKPVQAAVSAPVAASIKADAHIAAAQLVETQPRQTVAASLAKPTPVATVKADASANETPTAGEPGGLTTYRLGPGDEIRILVFGQQDLSGTFQIAANGAIAFPLLGDIQAASLSAAEVSQRLADRLKQGVVKQPSVSVEIVRYRPFYILGEVRNPGSYPFTPGMTVLKAVATAGGFSYRANPKKALITRSNEPAERSYDLSGAVVVAPGDTVRIPDKLF
jgi:polysaccharide export outer membrane protein